MSFRLSVLYGVLALVSMLALLAFVSLQVMGALNTHLSRQIGSSMQRLLVEYEDGGMEHLRAAIELTLSDRIDSEREIYLLLDPAGRKLAGNLDDTGLGLRAAGEIVSVRVSREGAPTEGKLRITRLPDGSVLVVGHDLQKIDSIRSTIKQSGITGIIAALLLVALGTYVFSQELERRVKPIRRTASQIRAGQLNRRIPADTHDSDEFTVLNQAINAMLDRVETLMRGVRHVSDTIAHNLRTPLTRLTAKLHYARRPGLPPEETAAILDAAIEEMESLNVLFGKLLQIAEIEAGVKRRTFSPCSLNILLTDISDMYEPLIEDAGLTLQVRLRGDACIDGDADLLASAVSNLVENALKYARRKICLELDVNTSQQEATIIIQDDGPGVPHEHLEKLGTHFFRPDESTQGHGLGLTSVTAIAQLHNGNVHFHTTRPGLKACLALPLRAGT